MRIIYNSLGEIVKVLRDTEKLLPIKAGLFAFNIDELPENADVILDVQRTVSLIPIGDPPKYSIMNGVLITQSGIVPIVTDIDKAMLKAEYINMINRLEQIQNAGAIPFTQAGFNQVVQAIKDEATYQERVMKFLKNIFT